MQRKFFFVTVVNCAGNLENIYPEMNMTKTAGHDNNQCVPLCPCSKDNSDKFISSNFPTWESIYLTKHPLFAKLTQKPRAQF